MAPDGPHMGSQRMLWLGASKRERGKRPCWWTNEAMRPTAGLVILLVHMAFEHMELQTIWCCLDFSRDHSCVTLNYTSLSLTMREKGGPLRSTPPSSAALARFSQCYHCCGHPYHTCPTGFQPPRAQLALALLVPNSWVGLVGTLDWAACPCAATSPVPYCFPTLHTLWQRFNQCCPCCCHIIHSLLASNRPVPSWPWP